MFDGMMTTSNRLLAFLVTLALAAAACGGAEAEGAQDAESSEPVVTTQAASTQDTTAPETTAGEGSNSDEESRPAQELPFESGDGTFSVDGVSAEAEWVVRCMPFDAPGSEPDDRDIELIAYAGDAGFLDVRFGFDELVGTGDRDYTANTFGLDWGHTTVEQSIEGLVTGPDGAWYFGELSIQLALGTETSDPLTEQPVMIEGDRMRGTVDIGAIDPDQPDASTYEFDLSIPSEVFDCSQL